MKMPVLTLRLALAVSGLLAPSVQVVKAQSVIGLTDKTPFVVVQNMATCTPSACKPIGHKKTPHPAAGGTAFDASKNGLWITSGSLISLMDSRGCRTRCKPVKLPIAGEATGLAMYEPKNLLLAPTTADIIYTLQATCPPKVVSKCDLKSVIPNGWKVGGIAVDDVRGWVFFTASNFGIGGVPANILYVSSIGSPCKPFCMTRLLTCNKGLLRHVTGLAWDPCKGTLFATDGFQTAAYSVSKSGPCILKHIKCCPLKLPSGDSFIGLAAWPQTRIVRVGKSCTAKSCPNCPAMFHTLLGGLPAVGNPNFSLDVLLAPRNAQVYMFLGLGPCVVPGLPFGCGRIHLKLAPPPILVGINPTGPGFGCTGNAKFPLPIPPAPQLCGRTFSSQAFVLCPSSVFLGHGWTNCLSWTIVGS